MRRLGRALAVLLVLTTACTGGGDDGPTLEGATITTGGTATGGGDGGEQPQRGGTLRVGIGRPATLDPSAASPTDQSGMVAIDLLFDSLTWMAPGAESASPAVAESWTASPDLRVWTFVLRRGVTFGNGREIVASDVKYSLERVARLGDVSLVASRLDVITGWLDFVSGANPDFTGIRVVDERTLEITLNLPLAVLPEQLSNPQYGIVPREAVEAAAPLFVESPVGSGPFHITGREGDVVHLARTGPDRALLDGVDLYVYDSLDAAYDAFAAGSLDWTPVPAERTDDAAAAYGITGFKPYWAELYFAFNLVNPKFADIRFRQAMLKAVDRQALATAVYLGRGTVLGGVVPAGVPGHLVDPCGPPCAHDVEAARTLVATMSTEGLPIPEVQLDYYEGTLEDAVAGILEANLEAVGIPAAKRPHTAEEYDAFVTSGQQELFLFGWVGAYPLADAYLVPQFVTGSGDNITGFTDPTVDALLTTARSTADPAARATAYADAERAILGLAPVIPLIQFQTHSVSAKRVRDLEVGLNGTFAGDLVWLTGD